MIAAVAPCVNPRRAITQIRLRVCVKEPEGNVYPLDFLDMILLLKQLRKQTLSLKMPCKRRLGRRFIELERNHVIGTKIACKLF